MTPDDTKLVSVVMSVFNGADYLKASVRSILEQDYTNFEFIIIDDGSTDETPNILSKLSAEDQRIRVVRQQNTGLTRALNTALRLTKGAYIARQDADDVSLPHRLSEQMKFMEAHPDVVLVGGNSLDIYDDGSTHLWGYRTEAEIESIVFRQVPFPHSTALFRRDAIEPVAHYDESFKTAQDMELWMRMSRYGRITMLKDIVLHRRIGQHSITKQLKWRQLYDGFRARARHTGFLGIPAFLYTVRAFTISLLPVGFAHTIKKAIKG